jgi:maltose-binding protein MalE
MANYHGNTPLHYACFWRLNQIALFLAKSCNAIIKVKNNYDKLPTDNTSDVLMDLLEDISKKQGPDIVSGSSLILGKMDASGIIILNR